MIRGHILDVYVDTRKNVMVTWVINKKQAYRIEDFFEPTFYVYASQNQLFKLAADLQDIPLVKHLNITSARLDLGSDKEKIVLEITPKNIVSLGKLAWMIDYWGKYKTYDFFNVDIRMPTRYLQKKGVFCNAKIRWDGKKFFLEDEQWSVDYQIPDFKKTHLSIPHKSGFQSLNKPITSIIVDEKTINEENEADTILAAAETIKEKDPDILYTFKGDSFLLPYLYHRAQKSGVAKELNLGRDATQKKHPVKQEKSYFSYGQIVYRPAFYTLSGRAHIDQKSSFLYDESGLFGLIDISRCANIPLQLQSRLGPGTAISQIQVNKAMEHGYLIPWKKNMPEQCKTSSQLLVSDRGGLILSPRVGLHDNVVELDFASLYPNIMLKFNISPETMLCECCKDSNIRVPQLNYHICYKKNGLIPEVLKPIIYRRFCFKARIKNQNYNPKTYQEIQQAWKWILIVCFGYTGYRNARFGRIECHESITAFARSILLDAVEEAEKAGYIVLHGIIDSLWVKPKKDALDPVRLSRNIGKHTGIRMDIEGRYKWIVFLPSKQYEAGALTRYYGVFDDGELKVRGVELRQRNTPEFLRDVQRKMLEILKRADNKEEFIELIPSVVESLFGFAEKIIDQSVDHEKLVFKNRVSRQVTEYKVQNLVKSALLQLRNIGIQVKPGQYVQYIVTDEHSRNYKNRVCVVESFTDDEKIDVDFYLRHIAKCAESILLPFGYTLEKIEKMLLNFKNREESYASVLSGDRTHQTCF